MQISSLVGQFIAGFPSSVDQQSLPVIFIIALAGLAHVSPMLVNLSDAESRAYGERWGRDAAEIEWLTAQAARSGVCVLDWARGDAEDEIV